MQSEVRKESICPNCSEDFGAGRMVWSRIFEKEICEFCDLEIGLEFDPAFGELYTRKAAKESGLGDIWEVRKRYLEQIIGKVERMLAKSDLDAEEREHRQWNLSECAAQLKAISDYRAAVLSCQDEPSLAEAVRAVNAALENRAFGVDVMRGCGINRITD